MSQNKVSFVAELNNSKVIQSYKRMTTASDAHGKIVGKSTDSLTKKIQEYNNQLKNNTSLFNRIFDQATRVSGGLYYISTAVKTVTNGFKGALSIGTDFEHVMREVAALSRININTKEGIDTLNKLGMAARDNAKLTKFTATEAGQALKYLALAGFSVSDSIATLPSLLKLATAAGTELGVTADIITDQLTALGMAASESIKLTDAFAMTMTTSNVDLLQLSETAKYASPIFTDAGYDVYDLSSAIGILGNSAIKGSQAGTTLRSAIVRMSAPSSIAQKALEKLNMTFIDSTTGGLKDFPLALEELGEKLKGLGAAERSEAIFQIFGAEAMSGMSILLKSAASGVDEYGNTVNKLVQYRNQLRDESEGSTDAMAETIGTSLKSQIASLKSNIEEFFIVVFDSMKGGLTSVVTGSIAAVQVITAGYTALINVLGTMFSRIGEIFAPVALAFAKLAGLVGVFDLFSSLGNGFGLLSNNMDLFIQIGEALAIVISQGLVYGINGLINIINILMYLFSELKISALSVIQDLTAFAGIDFIFLKDLFTEALLAIINIDFTKMSIVGEKIVSFIMLGLSKIGKIVSELFNDLMPDIPIIDMSEQIEGITTTTEKTTSVIGNFIKYIRDSFNFQDIGLGNIATIAASILTPFGFIFVLMGKTSKSITSVGTATTAAAGQVSKAGATIAKTGAVVAKSGGIFKIFGSVLLNTILRPIKLLNAVILFLPKLLISVNLSLLAVLFSTILFTSALLMIVATVINLTKGLALLLVKFVRFFPLIALGSLVYLLVVDIDNLTSSFDNLINSLGGTSSALGGALSYLTPIFNSIIQFAQIAQEWFGRIVDFLFTLFDSLPPEIQGVFVFIGIIITGLLAVIFVKLLQFFRQLSFKLKEILFGIGDTSRIVRSVQSLNKTLKTTFSKTFEKIGDGLKDALCNMSCTKDVFYGVFDRFKDLQNYVKGVSNNISDYISNSTKTVDTSKLERDIAAAKDKITGLRQSAGSLKDQKISIITEISESEKLKSELQNRIKTAQKTLDVITVDAEVNQKGLLQDVKNIDSEIARLDKKKVNIESSINVVDTGKLNDINKRITEEKKKELELIEKIEQKKGRIIKQEERLDKLIGASRIEYAKSIGGEKGAVKRWGDELEKVRSSLVGLQKEQKPLEIEFNRNTALNSELESIEQKIKDLSRTRADINGRVDIDNAKFKQVKNQLDTDLKAVEDISVSITANKRDLNKLQSDINEINKDVVANSMRMQETVKQHNAATSRLTLSGMVRTVSETADRIRQAWNISSNHIKRTTDQVTNHIEKRYGKVGSSVTSGTMAAGNAARTGALLALTPILRFPQMMFSAILMGTAMLTTAMAAAPLLTIGALLAIGYAIYKWSDEIGVVFTYLGDYAYKMFINGLNSIIGFLTGIFGSQFEGVFVGIFTGIKSLVDGIILLFQGVFNIIRGLFAIFTGDFAGGWELIKSGIFSVFEGILSYITGLASIFYSVGSGLILAVWEGIKAVAEALWSGIKGIFTSIFGSLIGESKKAGKALPDALAEGVSEGGQVLDSAISTTFKENLTPNFPHSDAERGPLSTLTDSGIAIPKTIGEGVELGRDSLQTAIDYATNTSFDKLLGDAQNAGQKTVGFIANAFSKVGSMINPSQEERIAKEAGDKILAANKAALEGLITQAKTLTEERKKEYNKDLTALKKVMQDAEANYSWYSDRVLEHEQGMYAETRRRSDVLRDIQRAGQNLTAGESQEQTFQDLARLKTEYLDIMAQAENEKDKELQKELVERAKNVAMEREQLSKNLFQKDGYETEKLVKDLDGQVVAIKSIVTAEESRRMAMIAAKDSQRMMSDAQELFNIKAKEASALVGVTNVKIEDVTKSLNKVNEADINIGKNIDFTKPVETAKYLQETINSLNTEKAMSSLKSLADYTDAYGMKIEGYKGELLGGELFDMSNMSESMSKELDSLNKTWVEHGGIINSFVDSSGNKLQAYYKNTDLAWSALNAKSDMYAKLSAAEQGSDAGVALSNEIDLLHEQIKLTESLQAKREADGTDAVTKVKIETDAAKLEVDAFVADANAKLEEIKDKEIKVTTQYIEHRQAGGFIGAAKLSRGKLLPGYGGGDRIKALLEAGEFVINKKSTKLFKDLLYLINYAPNKAAELLNNVPLAFNTGGLATLDARRSVYNDFSDVGGLMPDLSGLIPQSNQQMNASLTLNIGGATAKLRTNEVDLWAFQKSLKKAGY
jgi:TP901 family phage tail tape measure protein